MCEEIMILYTLVLKQKLYISVFHDKFHPDYASFLIRNQACTLKHIIRLPL